MKIGVIVAMDKELAQLKTILEDAVAERHNHRDFVVGTIEGKEIVLQQCGIGKVNSAIGAVEMINCYHPDLIISTGCAGGADVSLEVMDVVVSRECVYHDACCGAECEYGQIMGMPARFKSPADLIDKALALNAGGTTNGKRIVAGQIVSGEWFVDSREKMQDILAHFPKATSVDMESCSIAQTCHLYKTPFVSFRIISDVPLKDHKAQMYFDFWNRMAEGSFNVTRHFINTL
nr:5'-methylthioadenosine/adenosylhomocysteine nucleosidase [uncultured Prevotella sp.]